jgi:hypothetical protein
MALVGVLLGPTNALAQETVADRREDLRLFESVSEVGLAVEITLEDDREFQRDVFDLSVLESLVLDGVGGSGDGWQNLDRLRAELRVGFFGLYRTGGGTWGSRFLSELQVQPFVGNPAGYSVKISEDFILGRKEPKGSSFDEAESSLAVAAVESIVEELALVSQNAGQAFKEVVAFGQASATESTSGEAKDAAVLDALRRAIELAWGTEIVNTVRVEDFGGAEVDTRRREAGVVRTWEVLEEHTLLTSDEYMTVLVRAVLARPTPS